MKVVYMGTPDFAVAPLEKIIEDGHEVLLCITQPDREKGRGKEVAFSPVKECSIKHNIPVFQPLKIKDAEAVLAADERDEGHVNSVKYTDDVISFPIGTDVTIDDNGKVVIGYTKKTINPGDYVGVYLGDLPMIYLVLNSISYFAKTM